MYNKLYLKLHQFLCVIEWALDPDLDQNKHRINLEWVTTKIGINGLDLI